MTREEIYKECVNKIDKTNSLLLELPTGYGKSKLSLDVVKYLIKNKLDKKPTILLVVAKIIHKQTWKDEIAKWGGLDANITMECYESLHKHTGNKYDIILFDEVHHIQSDARKELLSYIWKYNEGKSYLIGLSATIPLKLKQFFSYYYHSEIVSCSLIEAIEEEVLPEPKILLLPLELDNRLYTEELEINTKSKGKVVKGYYQDLWDYKRKKLHAILKCTQKQKYIELTKLVVWFKDRYMKTRNEGLKNSWLKKANNRLEYLSDCKVPIVKAILTHLDMNRTITFCKNIEQTEKLGYYCIHSKNKNATDIYDKFNNKEIDHITAVNILNENANLVDCKYAVFCNLSSSDICVPQRIGRSLRHKEPVIIIPYYKNTREQEIVEKMFKDYKEEYITVINSIKEIK